MQVCTKCNNERPIDHFTLNKKWCKFCVQEYNRQYYIKNHEHLLESQKQYELEHREQAVERVRQWRKKNPGTRIKEYQDYYARNAQKENTRGQHYRDAHRLQLQERGRKYYRKHPDIFKPIYHNRRARKLCNGGTYTLQEWRILCEKYNNTCLCCGQQEPQIKLTPDHVIPLSKGGTNDIGNIQPLCLPCNMHKGKKFIDYRF